MVMVLCASLLDSTWNPIAFTPGYEKHLSKCCVNVVL